MGRGMATGDLDNDGRVDAVMSTNGGLASYPPQRDSYRQSLADASSHGPPRAIETVLEPS